ncbi:dipeptidyl aminopeptidase/acylaminoacyl peptidase [Nocardiopsis mwathae]|uniref:prolyl oligopeptidase n=1 Tax=Nocardiopsis mwathae TaxID=1472723 RepID=A0A7W9YMI7_9ACTN|nr:prolyl oligopeptidase family serine peptidase [Nocardiopsis mwathae]MBB6174912.1 dipeptidyl aminopeptidase/acylaminoacyl peptidase [Nocardiopsis mwathae]
MTNTPAPTIVPSLDTALAKWEHHGRPGLPDRGFVLSRLPGRRRRGIYRVEDDSPVFEPDGHILRMAPSPDGRTVAVQLAGRADEDAALALVDTATGRVRVHPEVRCRYDPMLWSGDSSRVELVADGSRRFVGLDVATGRLRASAVPPDVRLRLFPGGVRGLLAESRTGAPTVLTDRATGTELGAFTAIVRVLAAGGDALVDDGRRLHVLDTRTGTERWSWEDPSLRITSIAARGDDVLVAGVRAGRSVLLRIAQGAVIVDRPVTYRGGPVVATDVSAGADRFHVLIEGPVLPPRVVTADELLADRPATTAPPALARTERYAFTADDGADVPVVVTSPVGATGPTPLILTCYGGFGVPSLATFEPTVPAWIEHGGRYAIAQIRGGGEHGTAWREAGRGADKARGIDDLAAVARGLVSAGLTRPDLLVLAGASHGGVIVTGCALGSPGLCAGVVSTAAPLDLLHLGAHPLGQHWIGEFGGPDDPERVERLRRISPLHRARRLPTGTDLPRFLGIVLDDDSRVTADDTQAVADTLRRAGGDATLWRAPRTGHGSNHLDSLHRLGATVLGFAAIATRSAHTTPSTAGKGF